MRKVLIAVAVAVAAFALPASAHATFPGANGKIAFVRNFDIWTMDPDGTDQVNLTSTPSRQEFAPAWSPDGKKIAFTVFNGQQGAPAYQIWIMNPDGSANEYLGNGVTPDRSPAWSPDGTRIAFIVQHNYLVMDLETSARTELGRFGGYAEHLDWSPDGRLIAIDQTCVGSAASAYIGVIEPVEATTVTPVSTSIACQNNPPVASPFTDVTPSWSPDSQRIMFTRRNTPQRGLFSVKPDGTDLQPVRLDSTAFDGVWSPDGSRIAFTFTISPSSTGIKITGVDGSDPITVTDGSSPAWQPIPINSYPRPRGATPMRISLVPAYRECTAPNRSHGAPLSFGSCSSPARSSDHLTVGTPDANAMPATMVAEIDLRVATGDVKMAARLNDVFRNDLSDYTGALEAHVPLQITDGDNTPSPGGSGAATVEPFPFTFTVPCSATADTTIGSDCAVATSANALAPGAVSAGERAIWEIRQAKVFDGGADGDPATLDNTVFAVQGVFVP